MKAMIPPHFTRRVILLVAASLLVIVSGQGSSNFDSASSTGPQPYQWAFGGGSNSDSESDDSTSGYRTTRIPPPPPPARPLGVTFVDIVYDRYERTNISAYVNYLVQYGPGLGDAQVLDTVITGSKAQLPRLAVDRTRGYIYAHDQPHQGFESKELEMYRWKLDGTERKLVGVIGVGSAYVQAWEFNSDYSALYAVTWVSTPGQAGTNVLLKVDTATADVTTVQSFTFSTGFWDSSSFRAGGSPNKMTAAASDGSIHVFTISDDGASATVEVFSGLVGPLSIHGGSAGTLPSGTMIGIGRCMSSNSSTAVDCSYVGSTRPSLIWRYDVKSGDVTQGSEKYYDLGWLRTGGSQVDQQTGDVYFFEGSENVYRYSSSTDSLMYIGYTRYQPFSVAESELSSAQFQHRFRYHLSSYRLIESPSTNPPATTGVGPGEVTTEAGAATTTTTTAAATRVPTTTAGSTPLPTVVGGPVDTLSVTIVIQGDFTLAMIAVGSAERARLELALRRDISGAVLIDISLISIDSLALGSLIVNTSIVDGTGDSSATVQRLAAIPSTPGAMSEALAEYVSQGGDVSKFTVTGVTVNSISRATSTPATTNLFSGTGGAAVGNGASVKATTTYVLRLGLALTVLLLRS